MSTESSIEVDREEKRFPSKTCFLFTVFFVILLVSGLLIIIASFIMKNKEAEKSRTYKPLPWLHATDLDKYDTFFFDIDGVIRANHEYIAGAREFIAHLLRKNKKVAVITNNDGSSSAERASSMNITGLQAEHIILPIETFLKLRGDEVRGKKILFTGRDYPVKRLEESGAIVMKRGWNHSSEQMDLAGIKAILAEKPDIVMIDSWMDYDMESLSRVVNVLLQFPNVKFYQLAGDMHFVMKDHIAVPDAGSIHELIKSITHRNATGFGKPSEELHSHLRDRFNLKKTLFFGDNLDTDFMTSTALGIDSCLMVETGVHSEEDWKGCFGRGSNNAPTYKGVFADLMKQIRD